MSYQLLSGPEKPGPWWLEPDDQGVPKGIAPEWRWAWSDLSHLMPMWWGITAPYDVVTQKQLSNEPGFNAVSSEYGMAIESPAVDPSLEMVLSPLSDDFTQPWTILCHFNTTSISAGDRAYRFNLNNNDGTEWIGLGNLSDSYKIYSNGHTAGSGSSISAGWNTLAVVWGGADFYFYLDGELDYSVTPDTAAWLSELQSLSIAQSDGDAQSDSPVGMWTTVQVYTADIRDRLPQLHRDPFGPFRMARRRVVVSLDQTISAPVASATVDVPTASVSPGDPTPSAPVAPSVAESTAPQVASSIGLTAPVAPGTAEATAPTVDSPVSLSPPVAEALANAVAPAVSTASDQTLSAPVAEVLAQVSAPTVDTTVSVTSPVAQALAEATAPAITVGTVLSLDAPQATAETTAPSVSPGDPNVSTPVAEALAEATAATVQSSVTLFPPVAEAVATAVAPTLAASIDLSAPNASVEVTALEPTVSPGTASPSAPVAVVTVTVNDVSVIAGELFVNTVTGEVFVARSVSGDTGLAQTLFGDVEV